MIEKFYLAYADGSEPGRNLALESTLLDNVLPGEMILYLWQNNNTVLIGRNQNVYREVNLDSIERDGVHLMRRVSGGAAIYHDLGNLNYSFVARDTDFSADRQISIINEAISSLGIPAEIQEKKSIFVDGRKVSGSAYYHLNGASIQQSSILVSCDLDKVMEYIVPDPERFTKRGLAPISTRVANLCDTIPSLTVQEVASAVVKTCEDAFKTKYELYPMPNRDLIEQKKFMFNSKLWTYGRSIQVDHYCENRFPWGEVRLEFQVENGEVTDARVWSDSAEPSVITDMYKALLGAPFTTKGLTSALRQLEKSQERDDVISLVEEQEY